VPPAGAHRSAAPLGSSAQDRSTTADRSVAPSRSAAPDSALVPGLAGRSATVVITGLGVVGACGIGREPLAAALAGAAPPAGSEVDRAAGYHLGRGARRALLSPTPELARWLSPAESRRMSPPSRMAVVAARLALADAHLDEPPSAGPPSVAPLSAGPISVAPPSAGPTSVVLATAFGPCSFSEALLRQVLLEEPEAASPYFFTESVANAAAAQIAIAIGARGPNLTICQREAGALIAAGRAAAEVAAGRSARALAGAVDEMSPLLHALLDRFGALARPAGADRCETARPFDRRRSGFLAADGAAVLVLEGAAAAGRRGAAPLARILGWGSAFDSSAPPHGWGTGGAALGRALLRVLDRAGVDAAAVDLVVAGASGSPGGDRLEAQALRAAWEEAGRPLPPVVAPKAVVGEYGGGFLAAAVLAAAGTRFGPTAGFAEPDPGLRLAPHDGRPLPAPRTVLAQSLAAGGAASWLLLAAP
jgi:3-oxoacyl-[acyl-carrier-protein] synthase II